VLSIPSFPANPHRAATMFRAVRVSVLAIALLLSVISLGLAAYLIHWSLKVIHFSSDDDRFALVTSILSILALLPMYVKLVSYAIMER
jgi:hypothetical protein